MAKRPHIIIFNPDEMRADVMSHLGNRAIATRNLDDFAKNDAVSFSRAYCQNPVCVPSRCSFFTGLYPHVRGHRTMQYLLHPEEETLFSELMRGGYYVWMNSRNDLLAAQYPGWMESHADEIFYNTRLNAPGPLHGNIRGGKGNRYYYSHFKGELGLDENGRNYGRDDEVVDAAIQRILHPVDDRPLCLFLGLFNPHVPYQVEEPFFSAVDRTKLEPRVKFSECSGKSKIIRELHKNVQMDDFSEEEWTELRAVYQGMCLKVDDLFGRMVKAPKEAGIYDDCAIFFLSDHGDFAGDYDLPEKAQNAFEDCLTRVPFLVKPPKGIDFEPGVSDALTELVDFYATALDFAGVPSSHTHFGRSLRRNLKEHDYPLRKFAVSEGGRIAGETHCDELHADFSKDPTTAEYYPKKLAQSDDEAHAKGIMMRGERYKYVCRYNRADELYDMLEDPHERHNLIGDPAYKELVTGMKEDLLYWLEGTSDIVPFQYDARFNGRGMLATIGAHLSPAEYERAEKAVASGRVFLDMGDMISYAKGAD